jgi:hypothetical protein
MEVAEKRSNSISASDDDDVIVDRWCNIFVNVYLSKLSSLENEKIKFNREGKNKNVNNDHRSTSKYTLKVVTFLDPGADKNLVTLIGA